MSKPNGVISIKDLSKLKMTYIGPAFADGSGVGGGARLKNMTTIFNKIGIDIDIISFSYYSDKLAIEKKNLNNSMKATIIHMPKELPRYIKALSIIPVFFYSLNSCRSRDLIFADFTIEISYIPAIIIGSLLKKFVILDFIDAKFFKIIPDGLKKYAANRSDILFAISNYLVKLAKEEYGCENVIYIPNFINTDSFKIDSKIRDKKRAELGINKDEIVIGYAGSFVYWEGISILIQAFRDLLYKYPNIKLAIMGKKYSPGDDDILKFINKKGIEKNTLLIPSQPHSEVPKFLSAFDILCCPKIDCEINRVANPVKVVEYLSMGLPTVCSCVGGIVDTIDDKVDGLLVKPGDVKSLEDALEWVILNPENARIMGENGREKSIKKYSYESFQNMVVNVLSDSLK